MDLLLKDLGIAGEDKVHDAESDAINTMYCLKGIINELDLTEIFVPTLTEIALMFGIGNAFDSIVSYIAYRHLLKKTNIKLI